MGCGEQNNPRRRRIDPASLPAVSDDRVAWESTEQFDVAKPTPEMIGFATDALRAERLEPSGEVVLVRHRPGQGGLPPFPTRGGYRFAIDFTGPPSSVQGGVLLFLDDAGRVTGWRAEAGALTIWSGTDPELTELVPGAQARLTLVGPATAAPTRS